MYTFQPTVLSETQTYSSGQTITYDAGAEIKIATNGKIRFLQETLVTADVPYRVERESLTFASDETIFLVKETVLIFDRPVKISIFFMDMIKIEMEKPNNFIVSQEKAPELEKFIIPCNALCKGCTGPTQFDCSDCFTNFFLQVNTC